jgi:hypothetical protein
VSDEAGERQTIVSGKGPRLSGDSCDGANTGRRDVNNDDGRHYRGARVTVGRVEEDLDEWIPSGRCENGGGITQCKAEGDGHDESQCAIDGSRSHNGPRKYNGSIFDFLSHMYRGVGTEQGVDWSQEADHESKAVGWPAAEIGNAGEDARGGASRSEDPQRNKDCEETEHVDDQHYALHERELFGEERIEDDAKRNDRHNEKRSMPAFEVVSVEIVQNDESLNDGSHNETQRCKADLPAQNGDPPLTCQHLINNTLLTSAIPTSQLKKR